ncbi:MAG TPA: Zn-dependent alcohol dehydrogenase [Vineibacter sp.]|nr:Zn-dependent alcohol dehydrogenase [Vineibacter sp.]
MKATAAVMHRVNEPLSIEQVDLDSPARNEVLIRTAFAGVCHSDLHYMEGLYPRACPCVLGHESAGVVLAVGSDVTYVQPGDHVITCVSVFCGECEYCLSGRMSLCVSPATKRPAGAPPRMSLNGAPMAEALPLSSFADHMLVHEHAVVKIRKDMPLDRAALIGCAVTTGVGAVFRTAKVEPGSTVAVIGLGGIGLSAVNGAAIAGAGRIIAIDRVASKSNLAREFGATDFIDASQVDLIKAIREMTGGGVDYAFECVGLKPTVEQSFRMLKRGGTATVIGMMPVGMRFEVSGAEILGEKRIQGCAMGSNRFRTDMPRFVDFYMRGVLKLDLMISGRVRLDQINEAYAQLKTGAIARNVIAF